MVDPDEVSSSERKRVSSPNVFVVQIADLDILNNDIIAAKRQALAFDHTFGSNA